MKKILIITMLALLAISCVDNNRIINDAERTLSQNPDSALSILQQIKGPESLTDSVSAKYWITRARVMGNAGGSTIDDSMLIQSFNYYNKLQPVNVEKLSLAYVALATYYWWNGEDMKPKAYQLLEQALVDQRLQGRIDLVYASLSELAMLDYKYADCVKYYHQALKSANKEVGDGWVHDPNRLTNLGNIFAQLGMRDSSIAYFKQAVLMAKNDSIFLRNNVLTNYAGVLSNFGDQTQAIHIVRQLLTTAPTSQEKSRLYCYLSRYYYNQGNKTTARDCMARARALGDVSANHDYHVVETFMHYDSTHIITMKPIMTGVYKLNFETQLQQMVSRSRAMANQILRERQLNDRLHQQQLLFAVLLVALLLVGGIGYYAVRRRRLLQDKNDEIEALQQLLGDSLHASESDDRFFKKILLQQLGVIKMAAGNPTAANQQLLQRMTAIAEGEVHVDTLLNWEDLYHTIDHIYDGFYSNLKAKFGEILNEKEMQLCCLLKANFSTKEIGVVTQQSVRTVYQRKTVIRQKLAMEEKQDIAVFLTEME